jgi:hypothetical protein|nr:MAG TPA: hypothetical protein [Crassvirales sp.]
MIDIDSNYDELFPIDAVNTDIDVIDSIYAEAWNHGDTLSEYNEDLDIDINEIK